MGSLTFEVFEDERGDHRWRLRHDNGNIVADSGEGYTDRRDCIAGIERVKTDAPDAPVIDLDETDDGEA